MSTICGSPLAQLLFFFLSQNKICREAQTMMLVDHPNVLKSHCSFVSDHNLWVIMPYMSGGSCLHILKAAYPDGLEEVVIATMLREALKGLDYLHQHGHIHRDVKVPSWIFLHTIWHFHHQIKSWNLFYLLDLDK